MAQILIVASDAREESAARTRLADWEGRILSVDHGARGIAETRSGGTDLVLVSHALSNGLDACEVCRRLKAVPSIAHVPIVVFSTRPVPQEDMHRAFEAGCDSFVDAQQIAHLARVARALLRIKGRTDELRAQIGELESERRRAANASARAELGGAPSDETASVLAQRELAACHPDAVLVVDADAVIRRTDRGACELFGPNLVGKSLASVAPSSGLAAFASNTNTEPREGFRFDHVARRGAPPRSILASVLPLIGDELPGAKAVLLVDVGKRRLAAELALRSTESLPRAQYYDLLDAARAAYSPRAFLGTSAAAERVRARLTELAARPSGGVLLSGEPGVGLRLCARILHYGGHVAGPFLYLRCASLAPETLERELFGWTRGAAPENDSEAPGLLQLSADGTLFLEGVESLPLELQARLAEAFESGFTFRMGHTRRKERCTTRVLATSPADVAALVRAGTLHAGLARWLSHEQVAVPPLRDRREDVDALLEAFVQRFGLPRAVQDVAPAAVGIMRLYPWPGNVAELADCVERACEQASGGRIEVRHLTRPLRVFGDELPRSALADAPPLATAVNGHHELTPVAAPRTVAVRREVRSWDISDEDPIALDFYEKKALLRALHACNGDKLKAAKLLRLGKSTIYRKLKEYGIT